MGIMCQEAVKSIIHFGGGDSCPDERDSAKSLRFQWVTVAVL
jgi:hypothetical protein